MYDVILFTHDDMDGAGCRIIFETVFTPIIRPRYEVVICSNNNIDDKVMDCISERCSGDNVIIFADICCSESLLKFVKDMMKYVLVFDHHLTNKYAIDILGDDAHIIHTNSDGQMECGTSLLYKYFKTMIHPHSDRVWFEAKLQWLGKSFRESDIDMIALDTFVDMIRSYDTYEWKSSGNINAKKLQTLFGLLGMEKFCENYKDLFIDSRMSECPVTEIISDEQMKFINAKLDNEQSIIDNFTPDDVISVGVMGYSAALFVGVVYANISELAYQFLTKYTDYDIFIAASLRDGGVFEIRTIRDDIDTGKLIAAPIGGGGHPKASGAPIDKSVMRSFHEALIAQLNQKLLEGDEY